MYAQRFSRIPALLSTAQVQAFALNPSPTLTYLSGLSFHVSERPIVLLLTENQPPTMIISELEIGRARNAQVSMQFITYNDNPATWQKAFTDAVQAVGLQTAVIGVDSNHFRFLEFNLMQKAAPSARFIPADQTLEQLRICKDSNEVSAMRQAVVIAQQALQATLPAFRIGVTELDIARELTYQLLRAGSQAAGSFSPIVAFGAHAANGHHTATDTPVSPGDSIVIDWGALYNGYISDLTRTFVFGDADPELKRIANIVMDANAAGRAAARPGIAAGVVDHAARDVITHAGYGEYFIHRTGHGIGMEVHEPPYIFGANEQILTPGMSFTVEPGIYLPGICGVRIEDNVVITPDGADCLSDMPRGLHSVG
ncbi:MAG TPA: Xaa-Pro peptidase family protein [Anaerolineaceae bacterium]